MNIVLKIFFFIAGSSTILARPHYQDFDSIKNYHYKWTMKVPHPFISIDGPWPIGPPYPYQPEEFSYQDTNSQQEFLIQSLNNALMKLNQLLAPSELVPESVHFSPYTRPEILIEALNRAIDRLAVILTRPIPVNPQEESVVTPATTTTSKAEDITTALNEKNHQIAVSTTEFPKQPIITPEKISYSVDEAIRDLNKLLATLPDELKIPTDESPTKAPFASPITSEPFAIKPFLSSEHSPNVINKQPTTTDEQLFTSNVFDERNSEKTSSEVSETSTPNITETASEEAEISTTSQNESVETPVSLPSNIETTVLTKENKTNELATRNGDFDATTATSINPIIDVRGGGPKQTDFIFPDEFEEFYNKRKPEAEELDFVSRFKDKENKTVEGLNILDYKPSRPPIHPDVFPPIPTAKPTVSTSDNNQNFLHSSPPLLHFPNPTISPTEITHPPHPSTKPESSEDTQNQPTLILPPIEMTPINPQTVLEYKPSRPPFHPDVYPPPPSARPQPDKETVDVVDRFQTTAQPEIKSTTTPTPSEISISTSPTVQGGYSPTHHYSTPLSLEYKPTRPFYAPNPIFYPMPIIPPGSQQRRNIKRFF